MRSSFLVRGTLTVLAVVVIGCSSVEKAPPQPESVRASRGFDIEAPRILRGTVAAESLMLGYQPIVVRGYGLVVGLNGKGSRDIPPQLRSYMLQEMSRRGVGKKSSGWNMTPEALLDSLDTAVVIVEGVMPAGSVGRIARRGLNMEGTRFNIRIVAYPNSGTRSLEGGTLWTADLRPATPGQLLPTAGGKQAKIVAEGHGPIFVNPYADPVSSDDVVMGALTGRILNGGECTEDMPIKLRLARPSHTRAELIQRAINTRFPPEIGQQDPTARGESDEMIRLTVPPSYRDRPDDFAELVRHTTIQIGIADSIATNIRRVLEQEPHSAYEAAWRWQALGKSALPAINGMYDHAQALLRLAALRAGASLGDPMVVPHLVEMTSHEDAEIRQQAVELLGDMADLFDPRIESALVVLLNDSSVNVRLAAYEALIERRDPRLTRFAVDDKFLVDIVESDYPMIYVTQLGQPRIAVFGKDLQLRTPLLVTAWSGRFMIQGEPGDDQVEVYYRDDETGEQLILLTDPEIESFVRFLAHQTTIERPDPGLGLSYSETVGALYEIIKQGYLAADFRPDVDRVQAAIRSAQRRLDTEPRPEFTELEPEEAAPTDLEMLTPPADLGRAETSRIGSGG